jgi:hypothetical protein
MMKGEIICYGLALVGVILTLIGRILLLSEASSISAGWVWAIRLLPLADVMFLARYWESAKKGTLLSLAGLIFLAPLGGKKMWDERHAQPMDTKALVAGLDGDRKNALFIAIKAEHDGRVQAKQRKLAQLSTHLSDWYRSMQERRAGLPTATRREMVAFNEEAGAYAALLAVNTQETAALQTLLSRNLTASDQISDDEYAAYLRKQKTRGPIAFAKSAHRGADEDL